MSRPTDWTPLNWYEDPVPGDPDAVSRAATRYGTVAESIRQASRDLIRVFEDEQLKGESFDALREIATEVSGRIGRARERYQGVSDALEGYVAPLRTAQSDSAGVLSQAETNRADGATADERVQHWDDEFRRLSMAGDPTAPDALERLQYWEQRRAEASQDVSSLITQLNTIIANRDTAATAAANAIAEVENSGDLNDDFWDNVDQWISENDHWISPMLEIAGMIAGALAIIAMFVPGLNLIVGAIVLAVTVLSVAYAWAKAASGNGSLADALLATALAVIPFGIGKGLSAIAKSKTVSSIVAAQLKIAPNSGNPAIKAMTNEKALVWLDDLIKTNPGKSPQLPEGLPSIFNRTSDFGELLTLQALAGKPILTNGNLAPMVWNGVPLDMAAFGWDAGWAFVDMVGGIDGVEGSQNTTLQNTNW